jgi:uncharacterized protein YdgA (DUF945 family)
MKKILVSIAVAAAAYTGAAWFSGYYAEKLSREQLAMLLAQPQTAKMNAQITSYRRGIFSSDFVMSMTMPDEIPGVGKIEITADNKLRHGPLLFENGISIGSFSSTSQMRVKTSAPELDKKITDVFGPSIGRLTTVTYFNGGYEGNWVLPAIDYQAEAAKFSIADSELACEGNYKSLGGNCRIALGRIELTGKDNSKVTIAPLVGTGTSRHIEEGIDLVDLDMTIDAIDVQGADKPPVSIKGVAIRQTQAMNGANIDSTVKFSLAKLNGPVALDNFHYAMDFNGFNKEAIKRMGTLSAEMPIDPAEQNAYLLNQMKDILPLLLQNGLTVKLDTGAQYMGTHPQAQWLVQYKAPADGRDVRTITEPTEYLQLVDSTLLARLPAMLVPEPLVAQYIDSHIARDGDDYVLRATLQDGTLTIGRTPIPKEVLEEFFAKMAELQAAAAAAQEKPAFAPTP